MYVRLTIFWCYFDVVYYFEYSMSKSLELWHTHSCSIIMCQNDIAYCDSKFYSDHCFTQCYISVYLLQVANEPESSDSLEYFKRY